MAYRHRTFHILLALADGPLHGYAIRKRVLKQSDGAIELEPGGMYRRIGRMESDGLIEQVDAPPDVDSRDGRRNYYAPTAAGRKVLEQEARRLARLVARPEIASLVRRG